MFSAYRYFVLHDVVCQSIVFYVYIHLILKSFCVQTEKLS